MGTRRSDPYAANLQAFQVSEYFIYTRAAPNTLRRLVGSVV